MQVPLEKNTSGADLREPKSLFWKGFTLAWIAFFLMYLARLGLLSSPPVLWAAIASTGFLIAGWTPRAEHDAYRLLILAGLLGCWFGDVIGPFDFMMGANAFFVAHAFFIVACLKKGVRWGWAAKAVPPMLLANALLLWWVLPGTPQGEMIKVSTYSVVISIMVVLAVGAGRGNAPLVIAAILFYISDAFVAFWRYSDSHASGWICYPIYYSACLTFAYSVHLDAAPREGSRP